MQDAQNSSSITRSVVNFSNGGDFCEAQNDATNAAVAAGMTVVAAAGNDDVDACTVSPASAGSVSKSIQDALFLCLFGLEVEQSFHNEPIEYSAVMGASSLTPISVRLPYEEHLLIIFFSSHGRSHGLVGQPRLQLWSLRGYFRARSQHPEFVPRG